jgi:hypothetical protein
MHRVAVLLKKYGCKNTILNAPLHLSFMNGLNQTQNPQPLGTIHYSQEDGMRSRSVSPIVLTATLDIPAPTARLTADWEREIALYLALEPGDVEALPFARARLRWPDYKLCLEAMANWTDAAGLQDALSTADIALMACRGARYHHDAEQYGSKAFCNLFLSEDKGLDLHFPQTGLRIPLTRGTAVVFDTGQTHAVIKRGSGDFNSADFPLGSDCSLVFLTWELPIENTSAEKTGVAKALQIEFTPR